MTIGEDTTIEPFSFLRGETRVGAGCTVGPMTTLIDSRLGDEVRVVHSYLNECEVGPRCVVGPFTHLRPGTRLGEGSKAGAFVEIKNSDIGPGVKVPHLSYIGDADLGEGTNIGRRHDHRQLRRRREAPHEDRARTCGPGSTPRSSRR